MFKWDHKAKTQQSIDQTNLEYELTSFLTHFIYQLERLKEMIKEKVRRRSLTYKSWVSDWNMHAAKNHKLKWL